MPYGIVLLPPPGTAQRIIEFATRLRASSPSLMVISDERLPHLSLAHADCSKNSAEAWWTRAIAIVPEYMPIKLAGLMFAPVGAGDFYIPEGGIYFGLEAIATDVLRGAHEQILSAAEAVNAKPIGNVRDKFRPHITLGVMSTSAVTLVDFPEWMTGEALVGRLAWGQLGSYGTFPDLHTRA
ncbi:hypothetical protein GT755_23280 [Herbidospora sp. NEAU-GS84]|uniref:2'-5' RNA ligase family protein n=1 Tax=Herbidospora solisilvae TaxID=2696284 RepID=A0A7C9J5T3_9ACTN|nr:hypothetical protein [Herbidospora solisilvae]NAS24600.1 hypothetical protein [Herbidospora solisilvae]